MGRNTLKKLFDLAERRDPKSLYQLGLLFHEGGYRDDLSILKDEDEALYLIHQAAKRGYTQAINWISEHTLTEDEWNKIEKDKGKSHIRLLWKRVQTYNKERQPKKFTHAEVAQDGIMSISTGFLGRQAFVQKYGDVSIVHSSIKSKLLALFFFIVLLLFSCLLFYYSNQDTKYATLFLLSGMPIAAVGGAGFVLTLFSLITHRFENFRKTFLTYLVNIVLWSFVALMIFVFIEDIIN